MITLPIYSCNRFIIYDVTLIYNIFFNGPKPNHPTHGPTMTMPSPPNSILAQRRLDCSQHEANEQSKPLHPFPLPIYSCNRFIIYDVTLIYNIFFNGPKPNHPTHGPTMIMPSPPNSILAQRRLDCSQHEANEQSKPLHPFPCSRPYDMILQDVSLKF